MVTWSLSLGDQESLLESIYLKAGFEQSVKDFINNDIRCKGDANAKNASFLSVVFDDVSNTESGKRKAISGNGKCTWNKQACSKSLKKNKNANEELIAQLNASGALFRQADKADFCEDFLKETIFDSFQKMIIAASEFDYSIDVDVLPELKGALSLQYKVEFKPAAGVGLDNVNEVDLSSNDEPIEINTVCTDSQCSSQRDTMRGIFDYFEVPFNENKHECLNIGINCDADGLVTYIWLANMDKIKRSSDNTIPAAFGSLPSLKGLFLGNNSLTGTIPTSFGQLRSLQLLWLENNLLRGPIPSHLGNVRSLRELNLKNNQLSGSIPSEFGNLQNLERMDLGGNSLSGTVPPFNRVKNVPIPPCGNAFPNFFNTFKKVFGESKINWSLYVAQSNNETAPLTNLKSLSLEGNNLNGPIPTDLFLLSGLNDISFGKLKF